MPESTATGYLFGIFDLFHIGHLDTILQAATQCERLIVGVASDYLVESTCGIRPLVPWIERVEIVGAIRVVVEARVLDSLDLQTEAKRVGADVVFAPGGELDWVQLAVLNESVAPPSTSSGLRLMHLTGGRQSASRSLSAALAGTTTGSSVA